ncbi:glycosyltransferase [Pseudofrankia sp. BMG5.36]|uniref:glycosyltransferase n=1 Tax=Pseudofrankia sp. BMG5.36 TaxID=1834512 RepID=UPI0008D91A83|nr:glycosyltransferase [Pseudofrankia sp. BMG5.36]OHV58731.1 UDP-glucuronosyltransferase [Pseudofrankia sp. BMG5.36]
MSTFLLVTPPLVGHITPLVAVADRLAELGHRVCWAGEPALVRKLAGEDAWVHPCDAGLADVAERGAGLRGYAAVRFLWEDFLLPLADATHAAVTDAAERTGADLVVADMQALAGPVAAARLGIPWVTSATTSGSLRDPFTTTPRIRQWLDGQFSDLIGRVSAGSVRTLTPATLERSPHLVVAFTTEALAGPADPGGPPILWAGPALRRRDAPRGTVSGVEAFPWAWRDPSRPLVVVSLGTVDSAVGSEFLRASAEALRGLGACVQGIVADPLGAITRPADSVLTRPYLPMLRLLPHAAAVVCHAGHNTVCEALAHDLPLVVAPIRDDQPVVAQQIVDAGAGIRLHFRRATPDLLAAAVTEALADPCYARAARRVGASFRVAGGAPAAADALVGLAARGHA